VDRPVFDQNKEVDNHWSPAEKLNFEVDIIDTITSFDFFINIRNSTDYKYSNLYFFIKTTFPNEKISIDTVECFLANTKGKWLGKGFGKHRDQQILFKGNGRFPMSGKYRFQLEQGTRDVELEGIEAIGIRIEKHKKK
jgi:gliding motility-associated lipoprotein GldH